MRATQDEAQVPQDFERERETNIYEWLAVKTTDLSDRHAATCVCIAAPKPRTQRPRTASRPQLQDDDRYTKQPGPSNGSIGFDHARVVRSDAPHRDGEAATKTTNGSRVVPTVEVFALSESGQSLV